MRRIAQIELILPRWIGTISGILLIAALALGAVVYVQAKIIDQHTAKFLELTTTIEALTDRISQFQPDRHALLELQNWRVGVTIASRSGWGAANRYIQNHPLPMPDGMTEETRPAPYVP